jgi:hypothetical protein
MTRQVLLRVVMSLLLLFSQQVATAHVISHWTGTAGTITLEQQDSDAEKSRALAQDHSCNKCLALAQFAAPLPSSLATFAPPETASLPVDGAVIAATHARTILAFHSRGPPQA